MKRWMLVLALIASCVRGEHRDAREKYDEGVNALVKGDFDAAEKALLAARSSAGVDQELLFRSAYDLGMAYASHADQAKSGKDADLQKGLELEEQAVSWFGDASRQRPTDADAKANLAIARTRATAISDELNKGEGKLEERLTQLIGEQRKLLDDGRTIWLQIKVTAGADPLAQQAPLSHLADVERGTVAEAGVIVDLAADEIDAIGKKPEDKRNEQEKVRVVQLKNLDLYMLEARNRIGEARRKFQELDAEAAIDRAEAAMVELKRAREQLLDPVTVMRELAQDELAVMQDTARAGSTEHGGKLELGSGSGHGSGSAAAEPAPVWTEPAAMAARQAGLHDRVEEIRARLQAGTTEPQAEAAGSGSAAPPKQPQDPKQQKMIERIKAALPAVADASAAMDHAKQALGDRKNTEAEAAERDALLALGRAIEQFSDLKQTIELAYTEQQHVLQVLAPPDPAQPEVSGEDRAKEAQDSTTRNTARLERLQGLLVDEGTEIAQQEAQMQAKAAQAAGSSAGSGAGADDAGKQQIAQLKERLAKAEQLRGEAAAAIKLQADALAARKDPSAPAKDADAKITELRKLFFSVIEHLKELAREQGETRDATSDLAAKDDFARPAALPGLITKQADHGTMAKAITDALSAQADAAAKAPDASASQGGGPSAKDQAKALAGAATEVRAAQTSMGEASTTLTKARDNTTASQDLKPAVDSQAKALEHLEAAIKLLEPPKQNKHDKNDQKQDQQKQDQQKQDQQKQDQQKKQDQAKQDQEPPRQGGAGQSARDEDARRQRERQNRQQNADDNVDKDW